MMRALEHFTRALFKGGESDLCVQFLYIDLSSSDLGKKSFSHTLSEEELNDLLCGEEKYLLKSSWKTPQPVLIGFILCLKVKITITPDNTRSGPGSRAAAAKMWHASRRPPCFVAACPAIAPGPHHFFDRWHHVRRYLVISQIILTEILGRDGR